MCAIVFSLGFAFEVKTRLGERVVNLLGGREIQFFKSGLGQGGGSNFPLQISFSLVEIS